jgi:hypothetical protein
MRAMTRTPDADGLQLDEDLAHQRREWRVQRLGWFAMLLIALAALAGLLGPGPLSKARESDSSGVEVEYLRFARSRAPEELRIRLPADATRTGRVRVGLPDALLGRIELHRVQPEPSSVVVHSGRQDFEILTEPGASAEIIVHYEHRSFGRSPASLYVDGREAVAFEQWVYP